MDTNTSHSAFARLLATEDIRVIHRPDAETASFDMVSRVLTLPVWKGMNKHLYDMLIGHEVAHALWTDATIDEERECLKACSDIDPENPGAVMGLLNVVEDARIERLIKEQYPGLRRDFAAGYRWIWDAGIFPIEEMGGISNAGLLDRLNLHFKVGILGIAAVPFSDDEQVWVDRMENTQTWDDVMDVTRDLYEKMKNEMDLEAESEVEMKVGDGDDSGAEGDRSNKTRVMTQEAIDNKIQDSFSNDRRTYGWGEEPTTMPTPNLDRIIMDSEEQERMFAKYDEEMSGGPAGSNAYARIAEARVKDRAASRERFDAWVKQETKTINYLLKQFDLKKAADEHRRTMITKSGRLDTVKMINYRWSEDIFAKNQIIRDGKNHGFIMYLDWSGSMQNCILSTVKQAILLSLFCNKAGIPVDLYAFSNATSGGWYACQSEDKPELKREYMWTDDHRLDGENKPCDWFRLIQFVDSSKNRRDLMDDLARMFYLAETQDWSQNTRRSQGTTMSAPRALNLSGTPLEEAITAAHWQVPAFQRRHGVQVMNVVILTDGDGGGGGYTKQTYNPILKRTFGVRPDHENMENMSPGNAVLLSLKETTGCNLIGMYLCASANPGYAHGWINVEDTRGWRAQYLTEETIEKSKKYVKDYKKNGFVVADGEKACYYDEAYVINANIEPEADPELDDTNHAKLRSSFVKGMTQRSMSRTLTNRFVERVAC